MSGGVDSSVACYLLQKEGYDVAGATMLLLDHEESMQAVDDAKKICDDLGIHHYVFDLRDEFRKNIVNYFVQTYKEGGTPNPCVVCNQKFKFGSFYQEALKLGYDFVATGHYAKVENGKLYRLENHDKDQSYFLYGIDREVLEHVVFPLSSFSSKDEIRKIAHDVGLHVFSKKDSQEICFVPDDDYKRFLSDKIDVIHGDICLMDGTVLGQHTGIHHYTIGQRKGLGIAYASPLYVIELDKEKNRVVVGSNEDLLHDTLIANDVSLLVDDLPSKIYAKIRSRGLLEEAKVEILDDKRARVVFRRKQRAITRGQAVVFYDEWNQCLGGGIIQDVL